MEQKTKPLERIKKRIDVKSVEKIGFSWFYVVEYKGTDYNLRLFDFQIDENKNATQVDCLIEKHPDGSTVVKQDMAPLIAERYKVGQICKFKVRRNENPIAPYVAVTPENFRFYLDNTKKKHYADRSEIFGRIKSMEDVRVIVEEVEAPKEGIEDIDTFVEPETIRQIAEGAEVSPAMVRWATSVVRSHPDFAETRELLADKSAEWLCEAVRVLRKQMPEWVARVGKLSHQIEVLRNLRSLGIQILEQSTLTTGTSADAQTLRDEISACLNKADDFNSALNKINDKSITQYVQSAINSLERTGYIYDPAHRLNVITSAMAVDRDLLRQWMPQIINALANRSEADWKQEPLRHALVAVLSAYVDMMAPEANRVIDIKLGNNKALATDIIRALAMLLLLATKDDKVNMCEVLSRLCRYSSLFGFNEASRQMLNDKAFGFLLTRLPANLQLRWVDVKSSADILSVKANTLPKVIGPDETVRYDGRGAAIEVKGNDIVIRQTGVPGRLRNLLPDGLTGWNRFHVLLCAKSLSTDVKADTDDIEALRRMWREIEDNLFDPKPLAAPAPAKVKSRPEVGDEVVIRIDGREGYDVKGNPKFHAVIVSDTIEGDGSISPLDIVHYYVKFAQVEDFCDRDGKPFLLRAKVSKALANGKFEFDMQDLVGKFISDTVTEGEEVTCRMTIKTPGGDNLLITEHGYSLKVAQDDDYADLRNGDILKVEIIRVYPNGNVDGVFVDWGDSYVRMPDNECLNILLSEYAEGVYEAQDDDAYESDEEDDDYQQFRSEMNRDELRELMSIIDRQSTLAPKRAQAYNLLALARIMALTMNDARKAEEYRDRMAFILLMQQYAINQWIDTDEFERHYQSSKGLLDGYPDMQDQVMRLFCISRMDKEGSIGGLAELAVSRRGTLTANVAELVMAYNALKAYEMEDERRSIRNKINELLKVETRDVSHLDFMGEEGPTLEFKTSLVYPPDNNQRPNKEKQCKKLLTVICGMMNSQGGRLLVGVNDSGYAEGLAADFKELAGRSIYDEQKMRDVMQNFFIGMLRQLMPKYADMYLTMNFEDHNGRSVLAVDVQPSKEVMNVEGVCYRRVGSTTRMMQEDERKAVEDLKKGKN